MNGYLCLQINTFVLADYFGYLCKEMLLKLYFSARVRLETGLSSTNFARTATHTSSGGNILSADCLIFGFKFSFVAIATSCSILWPNAAIY